IPTRYGAFASRGNVDRPQTTRRAFAGTGIRFLDDTVARIATEDGPLEIVAVGCTAGHRRRTRPAVAEGAPGAGGAQTPPHPPRSLLHPPPARVPGAAAGGVLLYLRAHPPGAQPRLPGLGALFVSSRFGRRYDRGLHRLPSGGFIYTTTGVGLEGMGLPRARF